MSEQQKSRYPEWDLLESWVAVVESGSISEAARRLSISQAGISQRIKSIETLLGTALLDRSTRPARPTAAGQRLFEYANTILQSADQMIESVRNVTRAKRMTVRLGCVDSFAATVGPLIIKALAGTSQNIRLWSGITPTLDALLEARQLDLVVSTTGASSGTVHRQRLFSEPYCVVLPKDFPAEPQGSLSDLAKRLQLLRYSARSVIGQHIDAYLWSHGDHIERTCEFDATDPMLSLIAAGLGFAVTTPLCIWQSRHFVSDIRVVPLSWFRRQGRPYEGMTRTFYLGSREGELGELPARMHALLRQACEKQVARDIAKALGMDPAEVFLFESEGNHG
ncbi:MAG: LysR family transcriptional regulator [Comamonas sp.]